MAAWRVCSADPAAAGLRITGRAAGCRHRVESYLINPLARLLLDGDYPPGSRLEISGVTREGPGRETGTGVTTLQLNRMHHPVTALGTSAPQVDGDVLRIASDFATWVELDRGEQV